MPAAKKLLLAEASRSPRAAAYRAAARDVAARRLRSEAAAFADLRGILQQYADSLDARMAGVSEWQLQHLKDLQRAAREASAAVDAQVAQLWRRQATEMTSLAISGVEAPLNAIGLPIYSLPPMVPIRELQVLQFYVPTEIKGVTDEVQRKVQALMQQATLGGIDTPTIVKAIGRTVGPLPGARARPGALIDKAEERAYNILRTEMNRLHNLTATKRTDELAEKFPGLGKKWLHRPSRNPRASHEALDGVIIFPAKGQKFQLDGYEIDGPHDTALPAKHVVNCHCGIVTVYDADEGAEGAAESPYIAGDGSDIPSAGI